MEALAAYGWRKKTSVEEGLLSEGHRFDFYQAVKLLEILFPEKEAPGTGTDPERDAVHFRSNVALGFAATDVHTVDPPGHTGGPVEMTVNFMGLAGALGPLPRAFSELVVQRAERGDKAMRDFLDIFNHRLVSILYRARKKNRVSLHWRPPDEADICRPFFALAGLGTAHLRDRQEVPDRSLLLYTGLLARTARSMVGLARLLRHYFGTPVEIEPFQGRWYPLAADQITRIGESGSNQALGRGCVLGSRVWSQQAGFELRVGPLDLATFVDFLPVGKRHRSLCALADFYAGREMFYRVRLRIAAAEVPDLRLSSTDGAVLGWTSWLKSRPFSADDTQVALTRGG